MNRDEVISSLQSASGYTQAGAELMADRIIASAPSVRKAFVEWLGSGTLPTLSVEGFDVPRLMREHSMNVVAALVTLDWLLREPKRAIASLRRGHDRVVGRALERPHMQ